MAKHTCKNCGAIEDLETGQLTYQGDNPLLKEVEKWKKEADIWKRKYTSTANLLKEKNAAKRGKDNGKKTDTKSTETGKAAPGGSFFGCC